MKSTLIFTVLCLALSTVAQGANNSLGEESISRLISIFGLVRTNSQTKVLNGRTASGEACQLSVMGLTTEDASPAGIGLVDFTLTAKSQEVNFRAMSGQIQGPGAVSGSVQIQATHQDGLYGSTLVTQSLNVWAQETAGDQIKGVTVSVTDGNRGTLTCAF